MQVLLRPPPPPPPLPLLSMRIGIWSGSKSAASCLCADLRAPTAFPLRWSRAWHARTHTAVTGILQMSPYFPWPSSHQRGHQVKIWKQQRSSKSCCLNLCYMNYLMLAMRAPLSLSPTLLHTNTHRHTSVYTQHWTKPKSTSICYI